MFKIRRRKFLLAVGAISLSAPLPALAQQQKRIRRIGFVSTSSEASNASWFAAFRQGMTELRWVDGRDYSIDVRYTNGISRSATAGLATELIETQPDLLLGADEMARLFIQKTKTIPIVFAFAQDPVGNGLATSLRRPGGNATGLTVLSELSAKRLQLLKDAFPRVVHVALLYEIDNVASVSEVKEIERAARRLGLRTSPIGLAQAADIDMALKRGSALGAQAYIFSQGGVFNIQLKRIGDLLMPLKVPAISGSIPYAEAGGLMSYGSSRTDSFRRAAVYVDKIFRGVKPGDIPIEQPTKFEFVVNMKTAKAMGITIPQSILLRADRVIE